MRVVRVWIVTVAPHPWLKRWPHAEQLRTRTVNAPWHNRRWYVLGGSDLLRKDLEADEDVDSIEAWWGLDEQPDHELIGVLDEIITRPEGWSFDNTPVNSPLWTTKERAEQALREIERELAK